METWKIRSIGAEEKTIQTTIMTKILSSIYFIARFKVFITFTPKKSCTEILRVTMFFITWRVTLN